jgi:hypothetical protein
MQATADIEAGICGFTTRVTATSDAEQQVSFVIETRCEKIRRLAAAVDALGPVDALQELSLRRVGALTETTRSLAHGCCTGCVVPAAIIKAMQVAAGLSLPKDVRIAISGPQ